MRNSVDSGPRGLVARTAKNQLSLLAIIGICLLLLIVGFATSAVLRYFLEFPSNRYFGLISLFAAIHFVAWHYSKRIGTRLSATHLLRLSIGCSIAFCLIDWGLPLALQSMGYLPFPEQLAATKSIVAALFDILIATAVVFITVPLAGRIYAREPVA